MHILLLTHYYAPENGAPQRRWSALIERFTSAGHRVTVVCPPPHYPNGRLTRRDRSEHRAGRDGFDATGARVLRVSFLPHDGRIHTRTLDHLWVAAATVRRVSRLIRAGDLMPDLVLATAPALPSLLAGRAIARRFKLPLVAEMRDAWPDLVSHTPGLTAGRGPAHAMKRFVHEHITVLQASAAHVVTTTESFAKVLAERGIRSISVIRNGTNAARYDIVPPHESGHTELRVLYMGTIGRSQGLEVVVRAAARLQNLGIPVRVRIVGHGAGLRALRELNSRLGAPVAILGPVPGSGVLEHYAWADTCVVSLRDWEPFSWTVPSKLYELMATGRHVTAIVAGESADLVHESHSGDVVPPGDVHALVQLWRRLQADPALRDVGDSGRRWVAEHAEYDALAARYLSILTAAAG